MNFKSFFLVLSGLLLCSSFAFAFPLTTVSAQGLGMGGSSTALERDAGSLFTNPGMLAPTNWSFIMFANVQARTRGAAFDDLLPILNDLNDLSFENVRSRVIGLGISAPF